MSVMKQVKASKRRYTRRPRQASRVTVARALKRKAKREAEERQFKLWDEDSEKVLRLAMSYLIRYTNNAGEETTRRIAVTEIDEAFVWAHCSLRDAERCFLKERVEVIVNLTLAPADSKLGEWAGDKR